MAQGFIELRAICRLNLYEHCQGEGEAEPNERFSHTHLIDQTDENRLMAAIDCRIKNLFGFRTLWIESFVSLEKDKGANLLLQLLQRENSSHVALAAYGGSVTYCIKIGFNLLKS